MSHSAPERDFRDLDDYRATRQVGEATPGYMFRNLEPYQPASAEDGVENGLSLSVLDLIDRLNLLRERINGIGSQIRLRKRLTHRLLQKIHEQLGIFRFQLEEHRSTWRWVGVNPSADSRRTFLEGQVSRLEEKLYLTEIDHFNAMRDLERELFSLLPDYLQLKRVVETLE